MAEAKIVLTAEDRTAGALASLRSGMAGLTTQANALSGVFAGLVPALSFAGAAAYFKTINDGVDALNDLKDATGASIENISALEDVAARTGTSFDTVGTALVKFNQLLNEATPDSPQARALKAIGLEAEALKKMDPAEALRVTAVALAGFADDGNKARLTQELFGKSLKEVAPFLNDLAEKTELVGKVTAEQAAEAEKFNKELFAMQKNAKDAGRALTGDLVKGLNEAAKAFREGGFFEGMKTLIGGNDEFMASKQLADGVERLLYLEGALNAAKTEGYAADSRVIKNLLEQKAQTEENIALAQNYLKVLRGDVSYTGAKPAPQDKPVVEFNPDADKRAEDARKKMLAENEKARQIDLAGWARYAEEKVQADFDAAKQMADNQIKLNEEMAAARATMMSQWFETIDQEQEDAINAGRQLIADAEADAKRLKEIGADIGYTFSSAFEGAILDGKQLSDVIQGLGRDIAQIALREAFTKPMANAVAGAIGGIFSGGPQDLGAPFANGGIMTSDGPLPLRTYAGGGIANSPQMAIFGEGSMPEAYVPLPDGRRIPVALRGDGGGKQIVINSSPVFNFASDLDRAALYKDFNRAIQNGNAQLVDQLQRAGKI